MGNIVIQDVNPSTKELEDTLTEEGVLIIDRGNHDQIPPGTANPEVGRRRVGDYN